MNLPSNKRTWVSVIPFILLAALGILVRIAYFYTHRPIWQDEATLVLNVIQKPLVGLLGPLDAIVCPADTGTLQACPYFFLVLTKFLISLWGPSPEVLRILPLFSSFVFIGGAAVWLKRNMDLAVGLVCLALISFSGFLIRYATEYKQYGMELTVTTLLLMLFVSIAKSEKITVPQTLALAVAGAVAIWFSFSSVFVLASSGTVLFFSRLRTHPRRDLVLLCAAAAAWLVSLAIDYRLCLHWNANDKPMFLVHTDTYLSIPSSPTEVRRFFESFYELCGLSLGAEELWYGLAGVFGLVGVIVLWQRDRTMAALIAGPIVVTMIVSILHRYPWGGRFTVFLAMNAAILAAQGCVFIVGAIRDRSSVAAAICIPLLIFPIVHSAIRPFNIKRGPSNLQGLDYGAILKTIRASEPNFTKVYVACDARALIDYYGGVYGYRIPGMIYGKHFIRGSHEGDSIPAFCDEVVSWGEPGARCERGGGEMQRRSGAATAVVNTAGVGLRVGD